MTHSPQPTTDVRVDLEVDQDTLFACLAQRESRLLLGILYEQAPDPVTQAELIDKIERDGTGPTQSSLPSRLHHRHLPTLESAGLIQSGNDGLTITDHPAFEDSGIVDAIRGETDAEPASLDALFDSLAHARRRTVLDVLSHQLQPIHLETLAREVGAREQGTTEQEVPDEDVDRILTGLHHNHLPRMADADLIDYDRENGLVEYEGHPELRVPWMHSVLEFDFRESLTDESEPNELDTIEGRDEVVSYGQSLIQSADEELFCMLTHPDMLQAGCFTRITNAVQRGATVYLGTCDPTVHEYVEENLPEVVLWEPSQDWLNLPVGGNSVGRLVMVDREAVMLGTVKEPLDDEIPEEKAIVGEGANNALVVMIRQLLGSHLEEIDEQTAEVNAELPF